MAQEPRYQPKIYLHLPHVHKAGEDKQWTTLQRLEILLKDIPGCKLERNVYVKKSIYTRGAISFDPAKGKLSDVLHVLRRVQLPGYQKGDPLAILYIPAKVPRKKQTEIAAEKRPKGVELAQASQEGVWFQLAASADASYPDILSLLKEMGIEVVTK